MDQQNIMLEVAYSKDFKRDLSKLSAKQIVSPEFIEVMYCLQRNIALPVQYKDHTLSGDMVGYKDCHVFNDLVLIYRIENNQLQLIRINTHSQVFG
ncbi:type II toxin-antitoxin system RelE/ParE family toxin [Pasteurella testudinis]|uniref:type II toxin-antitoxin system RelE/ParE family toxin n=1 Tax=Pasteurella testudinis TaxID=761 RepID=UPI0040597E8E